MTIRNVSLITLFLTVMLLAAQLGRAQQSLPADERAAQLKNADVASLVPDNDIYKLPWDTIMENEITWGKRVWREVDAEKAANAAFAPGTKNLANILLDGTVGGTLKAYDGKDGRFIKEVTTAELKAVAGVSAVKKYRIKEDWLFSEKRKELVVRIVGLAPVVSVKSADGTYTEQVLFWIFYPDARVYLTQFQATAKYNWDQLLQSRDFASPIMEVKERTIIKAVKPKR